MTTKSFDIDMDKDTPDYTDIRNLGKQALASVLKNASNVNVIEKLLGKLPEGLDQDLVIKAEHQHLDHTEYLRILKQEYIKYN